MPDFSIKIVPVKPGVAGFQPDLPGLNPGDPLNVAPSSLVSWTNQTNDTHQVAFDDGSYTSNEILPALSSQTDYVAPSSSGSISYHCTKHKGETGSIVVKPVVPMPPITALLFALSLSILSVLPVRAQSTPRHGQDTPAQGQKTAGAAQNAPAQGTSQISCLAAQQPLARIPEIISKDGRLRATLVAGTEQVRMPMRYPLTFETAPGKTQASQPGDPQTFQACFPEWVRTFRSPNTTTPFPQPKNGMADPMPGPTLRAHVGDFIELTFINQIDPSKFGQSIDLGDTSTCDSTSAGYPGGAKDTYPNCFHGSTTANLHFHGTHTNPNSTGDNVFLEILSSKRLTGKPSPPPPNFDKFFSDCEAELYKGSHVEWPATWNDLPKDYTDMQKELMQEFDQQPNIGKKLWPVNQAALDSQHWPQYYIGSYPYCFQLPKSSAAAQAGAMPAEGTQGAGSAEVQAHQGMDAPPVVQQGGPLKMAQSPGTHWYHAHKHGSTTIDVSNGFVGALIIEGQYDDEINDFYKAYGPQWTRTQPVLVINQFGTSPNLKGGAGQDKGPDFSINGRTNPIINMKPGEVQMWRILNSSSRAGVLFLGPPAGLNWKTLAVDGVQLYTDNYVKSSNKGFLLAAGNRIDLLVRAGACTTPGGCSYPIQVHNTVDPSDLQPATPPSRGPFKISLATVKVAGDAVKMPFPDASPAKTFPNDLNDITDDEIKGTQIIGFGTVPQQFNNGAPPKSQAAIHTIDGKEFNGEVGVSVLLNKVEEWKVTNNSTFISHPFHIHINPFQVTEVFAPNSTLPDGTTPMYVVSTDGNAPILPGQCRVNPDNPTTWKPCVATAPATHKVWWDVFPIPSGVSAKKSDGSTITINGYFKVRSRFVDYPGWFVIHCHILAHEDRGMMTVVEITPLLSPYSHH
jgi:FtsP/CotA-like multicopper oxidase with cupredoxin domain/plastocyanin